MHFLWQQIVEGQAEGIDDISGAQFALPMKNIGKVSFENFYVDETNMPCILLRLIQTINLSE